MVAAKKPAAPKRAATKAPAKKVASKTPARRTKSESQSAKQKWPADVNARGSKDQYGSTVWSATLPRTKPWEGVTSVEVGKNGKPTGAATWGRVDPSTQWGIGGFDGVSRGDSFSSRQGSISAARKLSKDVYGSYGKLPPKPKYKGKK